MGVCYGVLVVLFLLAPFPGGVVSAVAIDLVESWLIITGKKMDLGKAGVLVFGDG